MRIPQRSSKVLKDAQRCSTILAASDDLQDLTAGPCHIIQAVARTSRSIPGEPHVPRCPLSLICGWRFATPAPQLHPPRSSTSGNNKMSLLPNEARGTSPNVSEVLWLLM